MIKNKRNLQHENVRIDYLLNNCSKYAIANALLKCENLLFNIDYHVRDILTYMNFSYQRKNKRLIKIYEMLKDIRETINKRGEIIDD